MELTGAARRLLLTLMLAVCTPAALAQWKVQEAPNGEDDDARASSEATVLSEGGHGLTIQVDEAGKVEARFSLGPGLVSLDPDTCPSFRIDDEPPVSTAREDGSCRISATAVEFMLGEVAGEQVVSESLLNIMNGSRLVFVYRMRGVGYDQTRFSLRGSKQSINRILGGKVAVVRP